MEERTCAEKKKNETSHDNLSAVIWTDVCRKKEIKERITASADVDDL